MRNLLSIALSAEDSKDMPTGAQNCSTFNPCGSNGYCLDVKNNITGKNWTCQCKYWWEGEICNSQSIAGKEMIALGVITGTLILSYHILEIVWKVRQRRKQRSTKDTTTQSNSSTSTADETLIDKNRFPFSFVSLLTTLLMIIITVIAIIIRWILLQPIHNDIVDKYNRRIPIYYVPHGFCSYVNDQSLNVFTFPIAAFLTIIFMIISKRASLNRDLCHGYVAPVIPLNFFLPYRRKFATVVFAIMSNHLLTIVIAAFQQERARLQGSIIQYLKNVSLSFVICICYYPMLAGVYIGTVFTLACATLYTWLYYIIMVLHQGYCPEMFYPTDDDYAASNSSIEIGKYLKTYGTGPDLVAVQLCIDIPRYLCLAYISIRLPVLLVRKIYQWHNNKEANNLKGIREEERMFLTVHPYSAEMLYVKNLFRSNHIHPPRSRSLIGRFLPKSIYEWRDDFRFSSRIFCMYAAAFLILFVITIRLIIQQLPNLPAWQATIESFTKVASATVNTNQTAMPNDPTAAPSASEVRVPFFMAAFTSLVICVIQILVLLTSIRRNLLQLFRGDYTEIPKRDNSSNMLYSTGNIHFAGFFIGYVVWGYVLGFLLMFMIYYVIGKLVDNNGRLFEQVFRVLLPIIVLSIFKVYINLFVAEYVFLQKRGQILFLNNYRISMIILYFNFFLDSFLGLAASFTRLIFSFFTTIIYTARLDYSPLGRQRQFKDAGYCAYTGFIQMEAMQQNPVMLIFASLLLVSQRANQNNVSLKVKQKWRLAVLLVQNPSLIKLRKTFLTQNVNEFAMLESWPSDA